MKASLMSNNATINPSIAQLTTTPFRWGWDSSHYVPVMWPYNLKLLRQIRLMSNVNMTVLTTSLSVFSTSSIRSITYWIKAMTNTICVMINIQCHTSFGYICKISTLLGPTARFSCSDICVTPSLRL